jgi:hypothetical protein
VIRYVAEVEVIVGGVPTTHYFGTTGFATRGTDTPAHTYVSGRLVSPGWIQRSLFSGSRMTGAVRPSYGALELANADGGLDAWIGHAVSGGRVTVRYGEEDAAYPAGYSTVYVAYIERMQADLQSVRLILRDRLAQALDQPMVAQSFTGAGGLEGTTGLAGKLKQAVLGDPGFVPPILVDAARQLWYVQSTGPYYLAALLQVYEGGVQITRGADYTSSAEMLATTPSPGEARFWAPASGPVYFRLGGVPVYDLRVQAFSGAPPSGAAWTISTLANQAGISGAASIVAVDGTLVDDDRTYLQIMDDACAVQLGWYGMTRLDTWSSGILAAPTGSPVHVFTPHNSRDWRRDTPADLSAPVWSLTVKAGATWPSDLAGSVTGAMADYLKRAPHWAVFARQDPAIRAAHPGAIARAIESPQRQFINAFGQTLFLDAYFALFGVPRDVWSITAALTDQTLAIELHDVVQITRSRYGLGAGKLARVISQRIDCARREVVFGVWG